MTDLSLGMIGYVDGNGHPFSFSAIINGYDSTAIRAAGWDVIADYLERQDAHDIGISGARVTCCWAEDQDIARQLATACHIDSIVAPADMLGENLDAVVIARDDWTSHLALAMPFLRARIPVFVDKPLTLDRSELEQFRPYLDNGMLMSCSALRYARELDALRAKPDTIGQLQLVTGVVPFAMARYGVHLLEAAMGVFPISYRLVSAVRNGDRTHVMLETEEGIIAAIHALGQSAIRFRLSLFGDNGEVEVDITDNFSSFRRCLLSFLDQVSTGQPAIPPSQTSAIVETLIEIEAKLTA